MDRPVPVVTMEVSPDGDTLSVYLPDSFKPEMAWEWDLVRAFLLIRQGWKCDYCARPLHIKTMTIEHMIARANGGTDHLVNLVAACRSCNSSKGKKSRNEFVDGHK